MKDVAVERRLTGKTVTVAWPNDLVTQHPEEEFTPGTLFDNGSISTMDVIMHRPVPVEGYELDPDLQHGCYRARVSG
jgi:hypothetical protein